MKSLAERVVLLVSAAGLVLCGLGRQASGQGGDVRGPSAGARAGEALPRSAWRARVKQELPLLGHRNWILIVDSAYPLQTSAGVETVETGAGLPEVTREVLRDLDQSIHVRPLVNMDAELPYLTEEDAPGVNRYREEIHTVLGDRAVTLLPHEEVLRKVDETGKVFHILVLKTTLAVPYTSVFLQLDCRYWSAASEAKLRRMMAAGRR